MVRAGTPIPTFPPSRRLRRLDLGAHGMRLCMIGPRYNGFPGPTVTALWLSMGLSLATSSSAGAIQTFGNLLYMLRPTQPLTLSGTGNE